MSGARLPARLYKYRSMADADRPFTESIFRSNRVWYARASTFNDPFDCDHHIDIDRTTEEWRQILGRFERRVTEAVVLGPGLLVQGLWNRFAERFNEQARAESRRELPLLSRERLLAATTRIGQQGQLTVGGRRVSDLPSSAEGAGAARLNRALARYFERSRQAVDERFGIFSLAERPDNILLWSHYAAEHTGICIEFDTTVEPSPFPRAHPVVYQEASPVIEKRFANILIRLRDGERALDDAVLTRLAARDVDEHWTDREIRQWFLTKSALWHYEREWRAIESRPGLKKVPAAAISGVILGCKVDAACEAAVRAWVKRRRRPVTVSRAVKRRGAFALDIVPLA